MTGQTIIPINTDDEISLENFVGEANASLLDELEQLTRWSRVHRVIYLWGEHGSGKTHLLNACCHVIRKEGGTGMYLNLQQLYKTHSGPQDSAIELETLTPKTLVCIDNLEWISQNPDLQENILAIYEKLMSQGGGLVVSAHQPLRELNLSLKDLQSRLALGGIYQVEALDDKDKRTALQKRAKNRGFLLEDNVMDFILSRYSRDIHALFSLLDKLDSASLRNQRKITIPFLKSIISV